VNKLGEPTTHPIIIFSHFLVYLVIFDQTPGVLVIRVSLSVFLSFCWDIVQLLEEYDPFGYCFSDSDEGRTQSMVNYFPLLRG